MQGLHTLRLTAATLLIGCGSGVGGRAVLLAGADAGTLSGGVQRVTGGAVVPVDGLDANAGTAFLLGHLSDNEAVAWISYSDPPGSRLAVVSARGQVVSQSELLPYGAGNQAWIARESREVFIEAYVNDTPTVVTAWLRIDADSGDAEEVQRGGRMYGVSADGGVWMLDPQNDGQLMVVADGGDPQPFVAAEGLGIGLAAALSPDGTRLWHSTGTQGGHTLGYSDVATGVYTEIGTYTGEDFVFPAQLDVRDGTLVVTNSSYVTLVDTSDGSLTRIAGSGGIPGRAGLSEDLEVYVGSGYDGFDNVHIYRLHDAITTFSEGTAGRVIAVDARYFGTAAVF